MKSPRPRHVSTRLANFWMHAYFLLSNDAKMAKSAASSCACSRLSTGYDPLAYRYLCLTAHYRTQLNFTWDALDAAARSRPASQRGVRAR
jgi:cysteinyl-tRNA synthetase